MDTLLAFRCQRCRSTNAFSPHLQDFLFGAPRGQALGYDVYCAHCREQNSVCTRERPRVKDLTDTERANTGC